MKELEDARLSLSIGNANQRLHLNTTSFGKNYPYRDSCSTKNDPICFSGQACYWKSSASGKFGDNIKIEVRHGNSTVFSDLVPFIHQEEMNLKGMKCDKLNSYKLLF